MRMSSCRYSGTSEQLEYIPAELKVIEHIRLNSRVFGASLAGVSVRGGGNAPRNLLRRIGPKHATPPMAPMTRMVLRRRPNALDRDSLSRRKKA